jgi:hypothetical protein
VLSGHCLLITSFLTNRTSGLWGTTHSTAVSLIGPTRFGFTTTTPLQIVSVCLRYTFSPFFDHRSSSKRKYMPDVITTTAGGLAKLLKYGKDNFRRWGREFFRLRLIPIMMALLENESAIQCCCIRPFDITEVSRISFSPPI